MGQHDIPEQDTRDRSATALRAKARAARHHARTLSDDPAGARLKKFAEELEAKASEIESHCRPPVPPGAEC